MSTQYREDALRHTLENLHRRLPVALASVIVDNAGLLVTAYPAGDRDDSPTGGDQVAAMASVLMGLAGRTLDRLEQGEVGRMLIEAEHGILVVVPATGEAALAVLIGKQAKIGLAMHAIRRCAEEIRAILL
jgi:predicted regulator of Ras-like GTPase activity (Roadblock/LC7/MglB family)